MNGHLSSAWLLAVALCCASSSHAQLSEAVPTAPPPVASASGQPGPVAIQTLPSWQDAALLDKAWALPVASRYKANIEFQQNLTFCGPTSIVNVGRSWGLAIDQSVVLDGTGIGTTLGYLPAGLTLDELAGVARHRFASSRVSVLRGLDLNAFRQHLRQANELGRRYIVNFSRKPLFGQGGGHHSPIAAYLAQEDLVLVLDVNRDFGPWLVKPERLLAAMNTVDGSSGKPRGLLLIER